MSAPLRIINLIFLPKLSMAQYSKYVLIWSAHTLGTFSPFFFSFHGLIILQVLRFPCSQQANPFFSLHSKPFVGGIQRNKTNFSFFLCHREQQTKGILTEDVPLDERYGE
jgi:hypothetical protein